MVAIDEIQTDVVVEPGPQGGRAEGPEIETQKELLREIVRELLREELETYTRTEARR